MNWPRIGARLWCFFNLVCVEHGSRKYWSWWDVFFIPHSGVICDKCLGEQREAALQRRLRADTRLADMARLAKGEQ